MEISFERNEEVLFRTAQAYYQHSKRRKIMLMISRGSWPFLVVMIVVLALNLYGTLAMVLIIAGLIAGILFAIFSFDYFLHREVARMIRKRTPTGTLTYKFYPEAFTETMNGETQECPYSLVKEVYVSETVIQVYLLQNSLFVIDKTGLSEAQISEVLSYFSNKEIPIVNAK
ncbi:YcxB family protein [Culicoidibacter larvae]|uniref:YcxB family protein n=1 Tax=Culicoidibacter larvae TaxID=2579976 RepID=A0A5R8QGJ3_9FIRM|nr:YcxB family protein [Culicoidibacter larvae]TLG77151.1 YcxB family protein [Culicoidibacter larvae]